MEELILVDCLDNEIGSTSKEDAHFNCKLHRAFSIFLFDKNEMLIQRRAFDKYHSGGLWANSCCSHPRANKTMQESLDDRLQHELNLSPIKLTEIFDFTYLTKFNENMYEYEYDHVFVGNLNKQEINFNKDEICETKWIDIDQLSKELTTNPEIFASWFLICAPKVIKYIKTYI